MRVALFTDADVFAGTERHIFDLACALRNIGVAVQLACPCPSPLADAAAQEKFTVISIAKRGVLDRRAVQELASFLRNGRLDLIHAHNGRTALISAMAVALAGRGSFVATQHFLQPARSARVGLRAAVSATLHRWVARRARGLIAVSQSARNAMILRGDAPDHRITVIPNGIAEPQSVIGRAEARRRVGLDPDIPLVLCPARLEPEKDIVSLVRAMALVISEVPKVRCIVAGEGRERARLEQEIALLKLENVVMLRGFCRNMSDLFAASDLVVLPSLAEPFGLVLLEAMAHERAVIATRVGGPMEIVVEGETGMLVPPADPTALAGAMSQMLRDPPRRDEMGRRGHQRVSEHFSAAAMAQATARVYELARRL